ncbi:MAG: DUF1566 domain-containing protein [Deltaproteobacteria bacterium]|nr:DUF1566 domain-containing protein [Deltaproteobacteria bacterium]
MRRYPFARLFALCSLWMSCTAIVEPYDNIDGVDTTRKTDPVKTTDDTGTHAEKGSDTATLKEGDTSTEIQTDTSTDTHPGTGDSASGTQDTGDSESDTQDTGDSESDTQDTGDSEAVTQDTGDSETDTQNTGDSESDTQDTGDSEADTHDTGDSASDTQDTGDSESDTQDTGDSEVDTQDTGDSESDTNDTDDTLPDICAELADFEPCSVITIPDRDYDICISGVCQSPGCGTVDCNVPGPYFLLADSGQRTCFNGTGALADCPVRGEEYFGQDAQYGWDVVHSPEERYNRIRDVDNEPVVQDNVTGLMWQGCIAGLWGDDCTLETATELSWVEALEFCDALTWGSYDDWRLPDEFALQSIIDYNVKDPAVNSDAFPETLSVYHWASSTAVANEGNAWRVSFSDGNASDYGKDVYKYYVRCVRGGTPVETKRFTIDGSVPLEPIVTDAATGLIWQGCTAGQSGEECTIGSSSALTWLEALSYCENLSWGGDAKWRLPNIVELSSIVDNGKANPSIDIDAFPATDNDYYWSSSSGIRYTWDGWHVNFQFGYVYYANKSSRYHVRCVQKDADAILPSDCSGLPEFTPCSVVTIPDRDYDICIGGVCQSPGCGTADCNVPGPSFPLADSGQRDCFDGAGALIDCPISNNEAFFGQDAQFGWDVDHDANERYTRILTTPNEPVVRDDVTGRMWQGCAQGMSGDNCEAGTVDLDISWIEALDLCEEFEWGGYTDWRLPDEFELQSIVNLGNIGPAVDMDAFLATTADYFWTSSSYKVDESRAWAVDFWGGVVFPDSKTSGTAVRCVRGEPIPYINRYTRVVPGESTEPFVVDHVTSLMWQGCTLGQNGGDCSGGNAETRTWEAALAYCTSLFWGGYDNWRLPSSIELSSIANHKNMLPSTNIDAFPGTESSIYWSSSSYVSNVDNAWLVDFGSGYVYYDVKGSNYYARCVRSGP